MLLESTLTRSRSWRRGPGLASGAAVGAAVLLPMAIGPARTAFAQAGAMIVQRTDDGSESGPQMVMFSMPDMQGIGQPDYVHADLPVFHESLLLSEPQQNQLRILLEAYLESFRTLRNEIMPRAQMPFMAFEGLGGEDGTMFEAGAGAEGGGGIFVGGGEVGNPGELELDFMLPAMPQGVGAAGMELQVGAFVTDGADDFDGVPHAQVMISASGPDGEELPEEVMQQIEEMAAKLSEQIRKRIEEQMAANGGSLMPPPPPRDPESIQQRMDELAATADRLAKAKEQLKHEFLAQVRVMLAEEQTLRWPGFERAITRHKTMRQSRLDGEAVDLFTLVKRMNWTEEELSKAHSVLERYEIALHEALIARNEFVPKAQKEMDAAIRNMTPAAAISSVERASNLRVRVRNINEQYAEELALACGGDAAEAIRMAFRAAAYPRVYRPTFALRTYESALGLQDLDPKLRDAIESQCAAYKLELELLNDKIRGTIRRTQPIEPKQMLEHLAVELSGAASGTMNMPGMNDGPVGQAMAERTALDERHVEQLRHLLTPEQIERLPKKRSRLGSQIMRIERNRE